MDSALVYTRYCEALLGRKRPLAFVDLDLFDQNAKALVKRAGGIHIRVASKSVRSLFLLQRVLAQPGYSGVLAYSGWEAVHLAKNGVDDIVVAYPVVQEAEILAVADQVKGGKKITLMVDCAEHVRILDSIANLKAVTLSVAIDLDLSQRWPFLYFGVHRSWITDEKRLHELLQDLKRHPHLHLDGVMAYEAQIAGVSDSSLIAKILKKIAIPRVLAIRQRRVAQIQAAGFQPRFVNGGGTGSIESTRLDRSVTEISAGSGLYSPTLFDHYQNFKHQPAAGFALEITRKSEKRVATCFSGGYIASGSIEKAKQPIPFLPSGLKLFSLEGAGEVQTPVTGESVSSLKLGDLIFFRHAKAGELCERFNELHLISGSKLENVVPTYRGEGLNFG